MRGFVLAAVLVVAGATMSETLSAQTVEASVSAASIGLGPMDTLQAIETDGNPSTSEWLIKSGPQMRVFTLRPSGVCMGAWFTPTVNLFASASIQRIGGVDKLLVREPLSDIITVVSLSTPNC